MNFGSAWVAANSRIWRSTSSVTPSSPACSANCYRRSPSCVCRTPRPQKPTCRSHARSRPWAVWATISWSARLAAAAWGSCTRRSSTLMILSAYETEAKEHQNAVKERENALKERQGAVTALYHSYVREAEAIRKGRGEGYRSKAWQRLQQAL